MVNRSALTLPPSTDTHSHVPLAWEVGERLFLLPEINQPSNRSQLGPSTMTWDQNSKEALLPPQRRQWWWQYMWCDVGLHKSLQKCAERRPFLTSSQLRQLPRKQRAPLDVIIKYLGLLKWHEKLKSCSYFPPSVNLMSNNSVKLAIYLVSKWDRLPLQRDWLPLPSMHEITRHIFSCS